jgi:multidrug efflux pump subunit AcrB
MVDIMVSAPGLRAADAVELVGKPLEAIVKSAAEVEHVYTFANDDQVLVTARFQVGVDPDAAAVRIHAARGEVEAGALLLDNSRAGSAAVADAGPAGVTALSLSLRADGKAQACVWARPGADGQTLEVKRGAGAKCPTNFDGPQVIHFTFASGR